MCALTQQRTCLWPSGYATTSSVLATGSATVSGPAFCSLVRSTVSQSTHLAVTGGRLIADDLQDGYGEVCALGALGVARGVHLEMLDPEEPEAVAQAFGVAPALVREIVYENDEAVHIRETPEQRFLRVRTWVLNHITVTPEG